VNCNGSVIPPSTKELHGLTMLQILVLSMCKQKLKISLFTILISQAYEVTPDWFGVFLKLLIQWGLWEELS